MDKVLLLVIWYSDVHWIVTHLLHTVIKMLQTLNSFAYQMSSSCTPRTHDWWNSRRSSPDNRSIRLEGTRPLRPSRSSPSRYPSWMKGKARLLYEVAYLNKVDGVFSQFFCKKFIWGSHFGVYNVLDNKQSITIQREQANEANGREKG